MTYYVSSGTLNPTHSLTHSLPNPGIAIQVVHVGLEVILVFIVIYVRTQVIVSL